MTIATYTGKEEKDKQDRKDSCAYTEFRNDLSRMVEESEAISKDFEDGLKIFGKIALGVIASAIGIASIVHFSGYSPYSQEWANKINEKAKIEKIIKLEYQNEISKLDSAYNFMKNKSDSVYVAKVDSLKKVYDNKLEVKVK